MGTDVFGQTQTQTPAQQQQQQAPPPAGDQSTPILPEIQGDTGTTLGLVSAATTWGQGATTTTSLRSTIGTFLGNNPLITSVVSYGGTVLALLGFYEAVKAGKASGIAMSGVGLGVAIYAMGYVGPFLAMAWIPYLAIMAAIVVAVVLLAILFGGGPSAEEKAANSLAQQMTDVLWTAGPSAVVGFGTFALLLSLPVGTQPNVMQTITVPASVLSNTLLLTSGFNNIPLGTNKAPTVLVEHGLSPTDPDKLMIVTNTNTTNSNGDPILSIQAFQLYENLQFVSAQAAPQGCYIPFFTTDASGSNPQPNPAIIKGLTTQNAFLNSVLNGELSTPGSVSAVNLASAADKNCIDPSSIN